MLSILFTTPAWGAEKPAPAVAESARQILEAAGTHGGLVVHLGCGDARLTAALRADQRYVVHGLDTDRKSVEAARQALHALGGCGPVSIAAHCLPSQAVAHLHGYGPVSIEPWLGRSLPYVDNLVNLVVVSGSAPVDRDEITRVLCPGGAAVFVTAEAAPRIVDRFVKPRAPAIDDWPHALYDASNNCVSRDTAVGPPQHLQWIDEPHSARHHETLASVSVVVAAAGRLFAILDEAPAAAIQLPAQWSLVARDAFNGVVLWKRPIPAWQPHLWEAQNGPPELSRRLVADGHRVYVTLGLAAPVTALDAATGRTEVTYAGTEGAEEILFRDHRLYVIVGPPDAAPRTRRGGSAPKVVLALDAATGQTLWKRTGAGPVPMSLATDGERLCWLDPDAVIALDARTGAEAWRAERAVTRERPAWSAPTLVMHGPVVLCADRRAMPGPDVDESTGSKLPRWLAEGGGAGELTAYAAATGQKLWTTLCGEAYHAPIDVFVTDGLVWVGRSRARQGPDFTQGLDLLTGEVRCRLAPQRAFATTMPHHRCHRNRVAGRFLVTGRTGVEFIDLQTGDAWRHHWVRGSCQFGVIPANGLLYVPPHSCACYSEAKLTGLLALAPKCSTQDERPRTNDEDRLEQGPAYAEVMRPSSLTVRPADDWPTYRHDAARSGRTAVSVPAELKCGWQATLGGRLTSPVIADGRVLAAAVDAHTVYAVDASDGRRLWQFTAGGRIDSPPTVAGDRAVFGAADGWVYCLRTADGALAWRYRVAPDDRRCMAYGQLESPWPVHGSVLVHEDRVLCAAGRSSFLDGGIELCQLDLATGTKLTARRMDSRDPQTGDQPAEPIIFEMPGAQPDVLSTDGQRIFMRHLAFDLRTLEPRQAPPHLYSPAGFLDDHWWHRTYWIYGNHFYSGYIGWYFAGRETPAGRLLVLDENAVYGFAYRPEFYRTTTKHSYHLFGLDRQAVPTQPPADYARANRDYPAGGGGKFSIAFRWSADVPLLVRAMVLAGDRLFVAGPPADALQSLPAFSGQDGATLCAISAAEGKTLSAYRLDALPVFDGLAAAQGRLYLTLQDGRLLCLSDRHTTAGGTELRAKDPPPSTK